MKKSNLFVLCLCCMPLVVVAQAKKETAALRIEGTLVDERGAPVEGASCLVHKVGDRGFTYEIKDGVVLNPNADSDKNGKIKFDVSRGFLPADRKITIACTFPKSGVLKAQQLRDGRGIPVVLEIGAQERRVDLDEILGKIRVKAQ